MRLIVETRIVKQGLFLSCSCWGRWFLGGHVGHGYKPIAVAIFVVIPGNELYKVVTESNFSPSIKMGELVSLLKSQETT